MLPDSFSYTYKGIQRSIWVQKEKDTIWFPFKDITDLLGYSWKGPSMLRRVPTAWWKVVEEAEKDTVLVSREGLVCFLSRSFMEGAMDLLQCLTQEPVRVTQNCWGEDFDSWVKEESQSPEELTLAAHEAILIQHSIEIRDLTQRLDELQKDRRASLKRLSEMPPPSVEVPELSLRVLIGRTVREYAKANGLTSYETLWNKLYLEYRDTFHVDLKVIAEDRGVHVLDLAEEREYLPQMYALAVKLFKNRLISPTGSITLSQ